MTQAFDEPQGVDCAVVSTAGTQQMSQETPGHSRESWEVSTGNEGGWDRRRAGLEGAGGQHGAPVTEKAQ